MIQPLSPGELEKGRKNFMLFILVNNYAYFALSGNIITLLALRIQAGNLIVGLLSSFIFISYLFLIPGRELIKTAGTVRLLYRYYLARNLLMIPVVLVPFLSGRTALFIPVLVLTVFTFAFNTARGIHLTSDNPLMAELGGQNEQGSFLSRTLVGAYIISMASGVVVYFLLGGAAPLYMYAVIIGSGAAAGIIASRFLLRIPEPRSSTPQESGRLMASFLTAVKKRNLRNYFIILFLCFFSVSMIAPFIVVYFKQVFHALDSQIMLFTIAGNIGSLLMALLAGFSIDKLGAKPLYFAFAVITLATLVPPIAGFGVSGSAGLVITGCVLFFFQMMGTAGTYNAGRTYLLSALQHKEQLNFGVIYFFVIGVAGALGSFLGGLLLEVFLYSGLSLVNSFRLFFAIIALLYVVILVFLARLDATKPYSIRSALMFILSPRDLRALSLLKRLDV
ncbi:MAG: MFS transporter, partial [Spirochaetales bacterium]